MTNDTGKVSKASKVSSTGNAITTGDTGNTANASSTGNTGTIGNASTTGNAGITGNASTTGTTGKPGSAGQAPVGAAQAPVRPPATPAEALSTASQVEELADRLSACADSIHTRVMRDIHRYPGEVPESEKAIARTLLDAEQELRLRADALYADAAACIVSSLGQPQQHLVQLTADAAAKIQTITRISDGVSLVARLLGLAAAAATGQVTPILAALKLLKTQLDAIALHNAPLPSPPDPDSGASPATATPPPSPA